MEESKWVSITVKEPLYRRDEKVYDYKNHKFGTVLIIFLDVRASEDRTGIFELDKANYSYKLQEEFDQYPVIEEEYLTLVDPTRDIRGDITRISMKITETTNG